MAGIYSIPPIQNEPIYSYAPGTPERTTLLTVLDKLVQEKVDIPMYIGAEKVFTDNKIAIFSPHNHQRVLGTYARGNTSHVEQAIAQALKAKYNWENLHWEDRCAVFLKAAELIATRYRAEMNAATILCQSKTVFQSEIDAVCELVDFFRYNAQYAAEIYRMQPASSAGIWNRLEYRPLEGFIFAVTPFNFTAISGNLPGAPALMGNTVVWKPADSQIYSANWVMKILLEAGLPPGVINLVYVDGPEAGEVVFKHPHFSGLHFTGSTQVFRALWKTIGENIPLYKSYPRIVGETGGKDFIVAHSTSNAIEVATAITRGAFEFQGQKCSAASRAYISASIFDAVMARLAQDITSIKMGSPEDLQNFFSAVIDERAFDKIVSYIEYAKKDPTCTIMHGGTYDKTKGYFIAPTVILTTDPKCKTMVEEIFGPVITIYKFEDKDWEDVLKLVDSSSMYALTGAIFATDRYVIQQATQSLRHAAGNFYINDKPTGAVVNQQPFGGARGSGTNDKAGSALNLLRWVSPRTIKETFVAPTAYEYPFMK